MDSGRKYLFHPVIDRLASHNNQMSGGFPHSDIPGSKGALASPGLIAECHVLHRLLLPRHPPNALIALDPIQKETGPLVRGRYRPRPVIVTLVGSLTRRRGPRQDASRLVRPSTILRSTRLAVRVSIRLGKTAVVAVGLAAPAGARPTWRTPDSVSCYSLNDVMALARHEKSVLRSDGSAHP